LTLNARLARRWGCRFVLLAVLFWVLLWPVGLAWLGISLVLRYRERDKSHEAVADRRVSRFLSWYPASWRARYGVEFSELVRLRVAEGKGGLGLTFNVVREANAARLSSPGASAAALCWSIFWL